MNASRREILEREQKGRLLLPSWKAAIERILKEATCDSFLGLEETEHLKMRFFQKVRDGGQAHRFVAKLDFRKFLDALHLLLATQEPKTIVLFYSKDRFLGALEIDGETAFENLEALWPVVEQDFCVCTRDMSCGFCLEENYYDRTGNFIPEGIYEITAWGDFSQILKQEL